MGRQKPISSVQAFPDPRPGPLAGGLVTNGVRASWNSHGNAQSEVTGQAGSDVTAVTFNVDGSAVHATLEDGLFAAWWPGRTEEPQGVDPPNPDVTITLRGGSQVTRPIEDFNNRPM